MGVEGAIEAATETFAIETELKLNPSMSKDQRCHLEARLADQKNRREGGFEFLVESAAQARELTRELEPIAGVDFTTLTRAVQSLQTVPAAPATDDVAVPLRAPLLPSTATHEIRTNDSAA